MGSIHKVSNYLTLLKNYREGSLFYNTLFLNITSRCNARCVFCEAHLLDHSLDLTTQRIENLLEEARELRITTVYFSGGEPFLNKEIWNLISKSIDLGFTLTLVSNGLLVEKFTPEQISLLQKTAGLDISLESHNPQVHNDLRGGKDFFEKTVSGIQILRKNGICVNINTVINRKNYKELAALITCARDLDVCSINFQPLHIWTNYSEVDHVAKEQYSLEASMLDALDKSVDEAIAVSRRIGQKTNLARIKPWLKNYFEAQLQCDKRIWMKDVVAGFKCIEVYTKLFIHADGGVLPCAMLSPSDSIKDKTLKAAINGLSAIKDSIRKGRFPADCHKCSCQMMMNYNFSVISNPVGNFKNTCGFIKNYLC